MEKLKGYKLIMMATGQISHWVPFYVFSKKWKPCKCLTQSISGVSVSALVAWIIKIEFGF